MKAIYGIFKSVVIFLFIVGSCLASGCNRPPVINPALPSQFTIGTNQTYIWNLANHESDERSVGDEVHWALSKKGLELFSVSVNQYKQLVIISNDQVGTGKVTVSIYDVKGLSDSQEIQITIEDQSQPDIQEGEDVPAEGEVAEGEEDPNEGENEGEIAEGEGEPTEGEGENQSMFMLIGDPVMTIEVGKEYVDPGVIAIDNYDGVIDVTVVSTVNTNALGTYTVTYTATDSSGNTAQLIRIVHVVDTTPPVITIQGNNPANVDVNIPYYDAGASVTDNSSQLISINVENTVDETTIGVYTVTYTATDASGNIAEAVRTVNVGDSLAPTITIIGLNPVSTSLNGTYEDRGATASDNYDGDLTAAITLQNEVNTAVAGNYQVIYSVSDSHGNTAEKNRQVTVESVSIEAVYVPAWGTLENFRGLVKGVDFSRYKIVGLTFVEELWWTKPTYATPHVLIGSNGTFNYDLTTGGADIYATRFVFFLVPLDFVPPTCGPCFDVPVIPEALAMIQVDRDPNYRTVVFSGLTWDTKNWPMPVGPGPNIFTNAASNLFVDADGYLHLTIIDNECTEVIGQDPLPYGAICVTTVSEVDNLDKNVVLGLFVYDKTSVDDDHKEIDIEVARWGDENDPTNAQYVEMPWGEAGHLERFTIDTPEGAPEVTHYLIWQPTYIEYRTYMGEWDLTNLPPSNMLIHQWVYNGNGIPVPGPNTFFRMNLWLYNGLPPSNGQDVEVLVSNYETSPTVPVFTDDKTAPEITITGDNPATHEALTPYADLGATALDDVDGDISVSITVDNQVNPNLLGAYDVIYTVTDLAGNTAQAIRTVSVVDTTPPVIIIEGETELEVSLDPPSGENLPFEILPYGPSGLLAYVLGPFKSTSVADCTIKVDTSQNIHIGYYSETGLDYVSRIEMAWHRKSDWSPYLMGKYLSLALDAEDNPQIASNGYGGGLGENLLTAGCQSDVWTVDVVDNDPSVGLENAIAVNSAGVRVIAYFDWANSKLRVASDETGIWETWIMDASSWRPISLLVDSQDSFHIFYSYGYEIRHLSNSSGSWMVETLPYSTSYDFSVVIDQSDNFYLVSPFSLGLLSNTAGSWVQDNFVSQISPLFGSYQTIDEDSVAIDNLNNLHLCALTRTSINGGYEFKIIYASNIAGDHWQAGIVDRWWSDQYYSYAPAIDVGTDGMVHIVYMKSSDWKTRYVSLDPISFLEVEPVEGESVLPYEIVEVQAKDNYEYRLFHEGHHFMTLLMSPVGAVALRPHPGLDINGWGSTIYIQAFLPSGQLTDASVDAIEATEAGINITLSGSVPKNATESYGTWSFSMTLTDDRTLKTILGSGEYAISLDGVLSPDTGDLNLYRLASNYLIDVPLLGGGTGNTGDMAQVDVFGGAAPAYDFQFTWMLPEQYSHYPTDITDQLAVHLTGAHNIVDTAAMGFEPIAAAYKPSINITLTATEPNAGITFGAAYDLDSSQDFTSDSIGVTPLIRVGNPRTEFLFDVTFESSAIPGDN